MRKLLLTTTLLCGCAAAQAAPLAADTPSTTTASVTFTAPKGWSLGTPAGERVLTPAEPNFRMSLVDVGVAPDARAAVAAAWTKDSPRQHHAIRLVTPLPGREGWDERAEIDYETSPNEHLTVRAFAFRKDNAWTILLLNGSEAVVEKRAAAINLVCDSIRPAGYARESFAGLTPNRLDAARIAALKSFVLDGMQKLRIPGVGLALIDHGRVVFEGGLGVKQLGKPDPVDAHTKFMIASNTKGLATLMLATLVNDHKLGWDQRVTEVYPAFRLGSRDVTRQVVMRQLVCACTGLPRRDLEWLFNTSPSTPASATFDQLATTVPTSKFGEVFQYNNLMASAAGYIGGHIAHPELELGTAFDRTMQERVFTPLGMRETTFDFDAALAGDHASPHGDTIDGQAAVATEDLNRSVRPYRPAGYAWSTPHDLIRYVADELTPGRTLEGKAWIGPANVTARRVPNVPMGEDETYGMGLMTDKRWSLTTIMHGGSLIGYKSNWYAVTDAQVGAVLLTNGENGSILERHFERRLVELLYDGKPEAAGDLTADAAQNDADLAAERQHLDVPPNAKAVAALGKTYTNPDLGHITVIHDGANLIFDFGAWRSRIATRRNDDGTVAFTTIDPGVQGFVFQPGKGNTLTIRDGQHEYVYHAHGSRFG
jgi:CubicO group peptidase (beta-lactamase class C family)